MEKKVAFAATHVAPLVLTICKKHKTRSMWKSGFSRTSSIVMSYLWTRCSLIHRKLLPSFILPRSAYCIHRKKCVTVQWFGHAGKPFVTQSHTARDNLNNAKGLALHMLVQVAVPCRRFDANKRRKTHPLLKLPGGWIPRALRRCSLCSSLRPNDSRISKMVLSWAQRTAV